MLTWLLVWLLWALLPTWWALHLDFRAYCRKGDRPLKTTQADLLFLAACLLIWPWILSEKTIRWARRQVTLLPHRAIHLAARIAQWATEQIDPNTRDCDLTITFTRDGSIYTRAHERTKT